MDFNQYRINCRGYFLYFFLKFRFKVIEWIEKKFTPAPWNGHGEWDP